MDDGDHVFAVYACQAAKGADLVAVLADTIRGLYVDVDHLRDALTTAMNDASDVADPAPINQAIERTLAAAIPEPGTHPIPHLDVARNELAEALAHLAWVEVHGTVIPASRIRNKEVPNQPSRGRDLLGLEQDPLVAVIGEIKASSEAVSPPGVVDDGDKSLRGQFLAFLAVKDAVLTELAWAMKHAAPENHGLIARAMLAHITHDLPVCAAPVLVRPVAARGEGDFGTFRESPEQFAPARVRFSILTLDGALDDLANAVYEAARA